MTIQNTDDTNPANPPEAPIEKKNSRKSRRGRWVWLGILILILGVGAGGLFGYYSGIQARKAGEVNQITAAATTQYELGVADISEGRYAMAQQRLEYVLSIDPSFPGAADKLAEVMILMAQVSTPTLAPTPTVSPTPDLRGVEEIFNQAFELVKNKQWASAYDSLQALRNSDATYRAVDVDGLYYVVLRYRGVEMILNEGNLEGGIYNLTLAEKFAPIDDDANSYRTWARYYLNGASYWGIDWGQVVSIFSEIYLAFPNLRDGSGMTATERYRVAAIEYGDQLFDQEEYCQAREMYLLALNLSPNELVQSSADEAGKKCDEANAPTAQPQQDSTATPTPTTEGTNPTGEPTDTVTTPVPTIEPTSTPAPTEAPTDPPSGGTPEPTSEIPNP
jgi:tetratricopeptide (TPR) repeat protein